MLSERQQKILKLLSQHKTGITGEALAKLIGVSSRTIRTDIKSIGQYLADYDGAVAADNRSGYRLELSGRLPEELPDGQQGRRLDSQKERAAYILQRFSQSALGNYAITQQQLADELYISLSTLKNTLKEVSAELAEYDLSLTSYKTQGMQLTGSEAKLRYFLSEYCSRRPADEAASGDVYRRLFQDIDFAVIEQIILRVITAYEYHLTDMAVQNLMVHIAIAIQRAKNDNYIVYTIRQTKLLEKTTEFEVASSIFAEIFRELHIDTATSEIYYLAQHLMASKKYMEAADGTRDEMTSLVGDIIQKINESVGIDFSQDDTLRRWLALHLKTAIPRMRFRMNIRNDVLDVIKSEYPLAFQLAVIASNYIEKCEQLAVNENEIGYIAVHFGAALSRLNIKNDACVRRAVLVCASGMGTAVLLKTKLESEFRGRIRIIDTIPGYQLSREIIDDVDMVLTTVPIKHIADEKLIWLHHLLNQDELAMLEHRFFGRQSLSTPEVEAFFRPDCFFTGQNMVSREAVLEFLTEELKQRGLLDDAAKQSVFEREEASPTEIGNLVAIPHPIQNDPPTSSIGVLILDKPIIWDEQPVQLVFLISIARAQFKLWETIFLKLFNYLVKENGVKEILQHSTYEAFIKNFKKQFIQG